MSTCDILEIVWTVFKESLCSGIQKPTKVVYCYKWSIVSSMKGHGLMYPMDLQVKLEFLEVQALSMATLSIVKKFFVHHCSFGQKMFQKQQTLSAILIAVVIIPLTLLMPPTVHNGFHYFIFGRRNYKVCKNLSYYLVQFSPLKKTLLLDRVLVYLNSNPTGYWSQLYY